MSIVLEEMTFIQKHIKEKYGLNPYFVLSKKETVSNANMKVKAEYSLTIMSEDLETGIKIRLPFNRSFKNYNSIKEIIDNL